MAATTVAFEAELLAGAFNLTQRGLMAGPAYKLRQAYLAGLADPAAHTLAKSHPKQLKTLTDNGKLASFDAITSAGSGGSGAPAFGASLGTPAHDTNNQAATIALTTGVPVPAGGTLLVGVSWYDLGGATASVAGGGLTYVKDVQVNGVADPSRHAAIFRAKAPAGLASTAVITATFSNASYGRSISGFYCTSIDTPEQVGGAVGTTAAWNSGAVSVAGVNDLIAGFCWHDGKNADNTPTVTSPLTNEVLDFNNGANSSWCFQYRLANAAGSNSIGGVWSALGASSEWLAAIAAYRAS